MNKYTRILALSFWALLTALACNRDDISFEHPTQNLRFSADTVFLDTIYNQVRSETYAVKVYNNEDHDILIPKIFLGKGSASPYRINVDGKPGSTFSDIPLRKKDSLYIFIEIAPVATAPEAIAEDQINFESSAGLQQVTLFSVVEDAEFFIENKSNPNILNTDTKWTGEKAKIIFGNLTLAKGKRLQIEAGTKVYFHKNSGLTIAENAELQVNGTSGKEIIFRGDRNDTRYDTIPKNWQGISMERNSILKMNYAKVMGGTVGLTLNETTAYIENSVFHTHQEFGILALNSVVSARNLVMNNSGSADFAIFKGGEYSMIHCTLANYWNFNSSLPALGLYATNEYNNGTSVEEAPLKLMIKNSIIYTEKENAITFKPTPGQIFNYSFTNSLVKYGSSASYALDAASLKNQDPLFQNYFTHKMNLKLKPDSPAKGKGDPVIAGSVPLDILQMPRTSNPSMGAYQ